MLRALPLVMSLGLAGCAAPLGLEPDETERSAIVGGELSTEADDAVIMIRAHVSTTELEHDCTGTLVAPDVILTTLSCISPLPSPSGNYACNSDGSLSRPGNEAGTLGTPTDPGNIEVYLGPAAARTQAVAYGAEVFGTHATEICIDNIALVTLDRALAIAPAAVRLEQPVTAGEQVSVIGFGGGTHADSPFLRYRRDGVNVLRVGPDTSGDGTSLSVPRTFLTDDGPCSGDIGGPAVAPETGAVVGVYSRGWTGDCEMPNQSHVFTKVAPYASLLREALDSVGEEPLDEGPATRPPSLRVTHRGCSIGRRGARSSVELGFIGALALLLGVRRRRTA